jgi:hypothetical protein
MKHLKTASFEGKSYVARFYGMLKIPLENDSDITSAKSNISGPPSASILGVYCNQIAVMDESGIINTQM